MVSSINTSLLTDGDRALSTVSNNDLEILPDEILLHIFSYLNPNELSKLSLANHRLHDLTLDPSLWSPYCHLGNPNIKKQPLDSLKHESKKYQAICLDKVLPTAQRIIQTYPGRGSLSIFYSFPFDKDSQIEILIRDQDRRNTIQHQYNYLILDPSLAQKKWNANSMKMREESLFNSRLHGTVKIRLPSEISSVFFNAIKGYMRRQMTPSQIKEIGWEVEKIYSDPFTWKLLATVAVVGLTYRIVSGQPSYLETLVRSFNFRLKTET